MTTAMRSVGMSISSVDVWIKRRPPVLLRNASELKFTSQFQFQGQSLRPTSTHTFSQSTKQATPSKSSIQKRNKNHRSIHSLHWHLPPQKVTGMSTNNNIYPHNGHVVGTVSISALLKRLSTLESARNVSSQEIAAAVALIFTDSLSPVQFGVLLWALHTTNLDHSAEVLAACASSMRANAAQVDAAKLHSVVKGRSKAEGNYGGGLVCSDPLINQCQSNR